MDPLSIVGAIAKTSIVIVEFTHQAKDASEDLRGVSQELQALSAVLVQLAHRVSRAPKGTVLAGFSKQLESSLDGCALVVARIDTTVKKYQRDGAWTRTKWVMFGRGDMEQLRSSLEAYKMSLSIGLHVMSMEVEDDIKDDTGATRRDARALRHNAAVIQVDTKEILARVLSLQNSRRKEEGSRTTQWVESMAFLSSYAESSYQETIIDRAENGHISDDDSGGGEKTVQGEEVAHHTIPGFDRLQLPDDEDPSEGTRRSSGSEGDCVQAATKAPADILAWNGLIEADNAVDKTGRMNDRPRSRGRNRTTLKQPEIVFRAISSSSPDVGGTSGESLKSGQGTDGTSNEMGNTSLDVVVALDIGETSAAVAWMTRDQPAQAICKWPGGEGPRVPTSVACDEKQNVLRWGFQSSKDPGSRTPDPDLHFTLFLRQLYAHIRRTIVSTLALGSSDWPKMGVEFHLTAPDLMRVSSPQMLSQRLKELKEKMRESGIGTGGPRHCAVIGLTESEAAATAVLLQLPTPDSPGHTIMLRLDPTHMTILLTERSRTATKIQFCHPIRTPELNFHIEEIVSAWLEEENPEVFESLGPDGLGRLVQGAGYDDARDILLQDGPPHESYRLRFDGLPGTLRHGAFDIRDGTMELDRTHVERIFDSLVDKISSLVIDALVDNWTKLQGASARELQRIIALETADTPKYLTKRVMYALEQKSEIDCDAYRAAHRRNSDAAPGIAPDECFTLRITRAPPTRLKEPTLAAVEGLLIHRNAWNLAPGPTIECNGPKAPRLYAQARIIAFDSSSDYSPYADRRDELKTSPWPHPLAPIRQRWRVSDYRLRKECKGLSLELYFTLDGTWRETDPWERGQLKKLCTVSWVLFPWYFQSRTWKRTWWGRAQRHGTLEFTTRFSMLQSFKTGAGFVLEVPGEPAILPSSVKWHHEPPFLVRPSKSKGK